MMQKFYCQIIEEIRKRYPNFQAFVLYDKDSNILASIGCDSYDEETIGTILSSTVHVVENHLEEFRIKEWQQIFIKGKQNLVVLRVISENKVMMVLANRSEEMETLSRNIQEIAGMLEGG